MLVINSIVIYSLLYFTELIHCGNVQLICYDKEGPYAVTISKSEEYISSSIFGNDTDVLHGFHVKNCSSFDQAHNNSFLAEDFFNILNQIDHKNVYLDIETDNHQCEGFIHPASLGSLFENRTVCSWNRSEINIQSNNKLPEAEFVVDEICTCYWRHGNFFVVNSSFYPDPYPAHDIHLIVPKPMEISFNENEPASLTFNYSFDEGDTFVNVTWFHSLVSADDDDDKSEREIKKYEVRQRSDNSLETTDKLNLGKADLADSGNYQVTVFSPHRKAVIAEQGYSVEVFSQTVSNLELYVRSSVKENRTKKLNPKFLRIHESYRFYCKAAALPYPTLVPRWTPCDGQVCASDSINKCREKSCTSKHGTIESTYHWDANISTSGIFSCTANDNKTEAIPIIVTDLKDAQKNNGIEMDIIQPQIGEDILDGDKITIKLSLQKQYAAVICYFNVNGSLLDTENIFIFRALARQFSDHPLRFASDWFQDSNGLAKFKIHFDESSAYSNIIYINVENVSHTDDNGQITCSATDYNETFNSNSIELKVQQPISPQFNPFPVVNQEGYEEHKQIRINCAGRGVPDPKVEWYRIVGDKKENFSGPILEIESFNDSFVGNYCCQITNKVRTNVSCVYVAKGKQPYNPTEFFSLDSLSKVIFVIMTACTVVLLTVTPMSFQRRIARKEELKNLHLLILNESNRENTQLTEPTLDPNLSISEQMDRMPYNSKFEIPRELFRILTPVGVGFSGRVFKAEVTSSDGSTRMAATKTARDQRNVEQLKALLHEMRFMLHIGQHKNVLALIGACTTHLADGDLYVFVEFCEYGSLDDFLYKSRNTFVDELLPNDDVISQFDLEMFENTSTSPLTEDCPRVTTRDLLSYSFQAATGMDYLATKGVVHRDLASRNLLLTRDGIIKIGDFGLSRCDKYYQKVKGQCLPYKWMALESVLSRKYSVKSDIWSYGIVLWEIFSLAEEPYSGLTFDRSLIVWLSNGNRLHRPPYSPESMHKLMLDCWKDKPEDRPDFFKCRTIIQRITEELFPDSASLMDNNYNQLPLPLSGAYHPVELRTSCDSAYGGSFDTIDTSVENLAYMRYSP